MLFSCRKWGGGGDPRSPKVKNHCSTDDSRCFPPSCFWREKICNDTNKSVDKIGIRFFFFLVLLWNIYLEYRMQIPLMCVCVLFILFSSKFTRISLVVFFTCIDSENVWASISISSKLIALTHICSAGTFIMFVLPVSGSFTFIIAVGIFSKWVSCFRFHRWNFPINATECLRSGSIKTNCFWGIPATDCVCLKM